MTTQTTIEVYLFDNNKCIVDRTLVEEEEGKTVTTKEELQISPGKGSSCTCTGHAKLVLTHQLLTQNLTSDGLLRLLHELKVHSSDFVVEDKYREYNGLTKSVSVPEFTSTK